MDEAVLFFAAGLPFFAARPGSGRGKRNRVPRPLWEKAGRGESVPEKGRPGPEPDTTVT